MKMVMVLVITDRFRTFSSLTMGVWVTYDDRGNYRKGKDNTRWP
jgi:hypothetical protein